LFEAAHAHPHRPHLRRIPHHSAGGGDADVDRMTRKPWADKGSRHQRGYGSDWTRIRLQALKRDCYLCQECMRQGRVTQARDVDHIIPKAKGGTDDLGNLQSLCQSCHGLKTALDEGWKRSPTIGVDGWPA